MNKKDLISQLTSLVEGYTEGLRSANNKLFHSGQRLTAEKQEWEQKYHLAMAANKRLDEQNEGLRVEKLALLDVVSEWKSENAALTALNATLSEELRELKERCASQYQDFLKQEQSSQNWQGNYYAMQMSNNRLAKELDAVMVKLEEAKETVKDRQERYDEAYKVGNRWFEDFKNLTIHCEKLKTELTEELTILKKEDEQLTQACKNWQGNYLSAKKELAEKESSWSAAFAAAEERYEDFKKKSHGILATLEENLQKKQETIEALTGWKEETEEILNALQGKLKDAKDVIQAQENTIEWLDKRVKRLKEKKAKKEQND